MSSASFERCGYVFTDRKYIVSGIKTHEVTDRKYITNGIKTHEFMDRFPIINGMQTRKVGHCTLA